jgi:hypothetical protein
VRRVWARRPAYRGILPHDLRRSSITARSLHFIAKLIRGVAEDFSATHGLTAPFRNRFLFFLSIKKPGRQNM